MSFSIFADSDETSRKSRSTSLGDRIHKLRVQRKLTLREVADKAGISFGYLDDIELGHVDVQAVTPRELQLIAHGLGVSLDALRSKQEHGK